jgi:uncharacterized membrane protein
MILLFAFFIGVIAGLRTFMAPSMVSLAAGFGWIHLEGRPLHFMGHIITRCIFCLGALGELVIDKLPKTPSRKVPPQFIARVVTGSLSGATIGASQQSLTGGLIAGAIGAVAGTLGGAEFRSRVVAVIEVKDLRVALIEDLIAILGGLLIVTHA